MLFSTPVAITANTVYVVSYHAKVGRYAYTHNTFANAGVDNGPLQAVDAAVRFSGRSVVLEKVVMDNVAATATLKNGRLVLDPLKAGVSGGNGVYRYGSGVVFPNSSFNSSNYWVDVVFVAK